MITNRQLVVAGAALAVVTVIGVVLIAKLGGSGDGPPTDADKRELADTVCPRVLAPFLFRIEKDGKTSYVLGTRHTGISLAKFPPSVEKAFRGSHIAVFESIAEFSEPPAPTKTIEEWLGPDLWDRYVEVVGDANAERVNHRSAFFASATLVLLYEDTSQAIDQELEKLAKSSKMELVGLEDGAKNQQIGDQILGVEILRAMIKAVPRRQYLAMSTRIDLRAYCEGQLINGRPFDAHAHATLERSTSERTHDWMPKLEELFARGDVFVVVGNKHVSDDGALRDLLRYRGYTITRVTE